MSKTNLVTASIKSWGNPLLRGSTEGIPWMLNGLKVVDIHNNMTEAMRMFRTTLSVLPYILMTLSCWVRWCNGLRTRPGSIGIVSSIALRKFTASSKNACMSVISIHLYWRTYKKISLESGPCTYLLSWHWPSVGQGRQVRILGYRFGYCRAEYTVI